MAQGRSADRTSARERLGKAADIQLISFLSLWFLDERKTSNHKDTKSHGYTQLDVFLT
jgi:hypothetical protein